MVGRRVALLVATDRYQDTGLNRLAAPASDAKQLAAVLRNIRIAGFEVTRLYNKPQYVVGRAIGDFYRDRRRDDLTLLYFTGHGVKDEDGNLYLAMTDTDHENLQFTGVSSEQIRAAMEACRSQQKVLVLDCCYAGAFPLGLGIKGDPGVHALEQLGGRGCVVLTSSDAMQLSFEGNHVTETGPASLRSGPSSLFTRFLIEGLRTGKADLDGDGEITLDELYTYVHDRVTDIQPLQRPKKKENIEGRIYFAQNIHWTLPSRISDAVSSPYPPGKLSALEEIRSLHNRGNAIVKQRVLEIVRVLAGDDSKSVSGAASQFLSELIQQEERREAEETARREAEETARREAEETARREAEETARREAEETARREAEETARREAEETARREAEETARREAEETARREAEETARREAEETARREAEETARREAEETARREAEETARREAEETARREAEETARREAEETARREAEETARREAEETARREAEETARREAEETARREAEETARREAEETARREAEETARREAEETARREAEETARREAEETARREAEETARREAEETARREAEETARREAEAVPAAVQPDEPAGEPDLLTAAAATDVLAPVQPGLPDPGPATALVEPQPAGTLPAEIPPPRVGPSEPPTVGTIEPAPGGGLPDEDGGTPSPAVAAVAGNGIPAAAATAATDHPLASTLETAAGSGDSTGELGRLTVPVSGGDGAPSVQRPPRRRGPVTAWIRRHRLSVFALACATLAAAVTVPFISPSHPTSSRPGASPSPSISPRPAALGFGWVSLGNLSQTPSLVDVYLYSSGNSSPQLVQHGVAYGAILPYHAVNAGDYTVKVRAAGASASSYPVWSVSFTVHAGGAYTVAPLQARAQQGQLRVIDNDLTAPTGKSFVRVIQADINQGPVTFHCSCAAGAPGNITTDAASGSVSPQVPIPAGTWTMTATGPSAKTSLPVALTDGTVHNEIVISKPGGGIEIINLVQAPPSFRRVPVDLPSSLGISLIASVAFSPSGATLAIVATKICLWDIAAKDCTSTFGEAKAYSFAFSPDGKTLAVTGGIDSPSTYLWKVATASQIATLTAPNPGVYSVAFTHNGKLLAVGDFNGHTYLWDVATRKPIFAFTDPGPKGVNSVAFSPDGKILAVGDGNGPTYLWDVATRKLIFPLSDPGTKGVKSVAFSPDGKLLVAGDGNGHTYLWDVATGKLISTLPNPGTRGVSSVACSPDNTTMAVGGNNGSIYVWNVRNGKLLATLADPNKVVINSVAFRPDGQVLAASDNNGSVFLWYKS